MGVDGASKEPLTARPVSWAPLVCMTASPHSGSPQGKRSPLWDINSLARCGSAWGLFLGLCRVSTAAQAAALRLRLPKAMHGTEGGRTGIYEGGGSPPTKV